MEQDTGISVGYCRSCDYDLRGIGTTGRCPECGRAFDLANPKTFRTRRPRGIWRRLRWVVYPLLLIVLLCAGAVGWTWWEWKREQPVIAWARVNRGGLLAIDSIGPPRLQSWIGRWGYLLERAAGLMVRSDRPVTSSECSLSRLKRLTELELHGPGVGDELMGEVGACWELKSLVLWDTSVTDRGLASLAACRRLESLSLSGSRAGDQGLKPLVDYPELAYLGLENTAVDDRAIPVLKRLKKLTYLDLTRTKVTNEGRAELYEALPDCTIAH